MTTRIDGEITDNDGGDTTVSYYYCGTGFQPVSAWNIVETRNGSNQTTYQYVWGTKYTDQLILIDKNLGVTVDNDADADTDTIAEAAAESADARYLVHQDRNWNVIALTDYDPDGTNAGVVVERYSYTPYGRFVVLQGDSAGDQLGNVLMTSAVGNVFAHQGLPMDFEKGSYQNRWREYQAATQRFVQSDPLTRNWFGANYLSPLTTVAIAGRGYQDGMSLYGYVLNQPVARFDPTGLDSPGCCGVPNLLKSCGLECCALHDECYFLNDCDASSWYLPWPFTSCACIGCNLAVLICFDGCLLPPYDKHRDRWYCGCHDVFFDDPGNAHMNHDTDTTPGCLPNP